MFKIVKSKVEYMIVVVIDQTTCTRELVGISRAHIFALTNSISGNTEIGSDGIQFGGDGW
jgi:hypothetical protein